MHRSVQHVLVQAACRTLAKWPALLALSSTKLKEAPAVPSHQAASGMNTTHWGAKASDSTDAVPPAALRGTHTGRVAEKCCPPAAGGSILMGPHCRGYCHLHSQGSCTAALRALKTLVEHVQYTLTQCGHDTEAAPHASHSINAKSSTVHRMLLWCQQTTGRLSNNTSSDSYLQPDQQQHQWSKLLLAANATVLPTATLESMCQLSGELPTSLHSPVVASPHVDL